MKRSTACIRMLILLKARGFMTTSELAQELESNVRNISEYKKALEEAGYIFANTKGKFGGYRLYSGAHLPIVGLSKQESRALFEADEYLKHHTDFIQYASFKNALDKVQANTTLHERDTGVYVQSDVTNISKNIMRWIKLCEYAKKECFAMDINYKSMHANEYEKVRIHPYEIVNYKGAYYCFAYSLKAKDYRTFKFSEERMESMQICKAQFMRDSAFHVKDYIGVSGFMKNEVYELDMMLYKESAVWMSEKKVGIPSVVKWVDKDTLHVTTIMEGKMNVISFIMSLGNQCKLLAPLDIQQEIIKIARDMLSQYSHSVSSLL